MTALVSAAGLMALAAPSALASPASFPTDPGFSGSAWTPSSSCGILCSANGTQPATGGNPGGRAVATYSTIANVLGTAAGSVDFTSAPFAWTGSSPATATLHLDRQTNLSTLLSLGGAAGVTVNLVDQTAGTTTAIKSLSFTTNQSTWAGADYTVPTSLLAGGHTYKLVLHTWFTATVAVLGGATVSYDNVSLSAVRDLPRMSSYVTGTPTQTSVSLGATGDTAGVDGTYHAEWGTTTSYGNSTSDQTILAGDSPGPIGANLTGLTAGTTYHARLALTTEAGTTYGPDTTFTTAANGSPVPTGPSVGTATATVTDARHADLSAIVDPNGLTGTDYRFEYGPTTSYGSTTAITSVPAAGASGYSALAASLANLTPGTTYHVRAAVRSGGVWTNGADVTFATPAIAAPTASAPTATVTDTIAQIASSIIPGSSAATWHLEWGLDTSYGHTSVPVTIPAGILPTQAVYDITGLQPDTDYHVRLVLSSLDGGTDYGTDIVLHTSSDGSTTTILPIIQRPTVDVISDSRVDLSTLVDLSGQTGGEYRYQYGLDTNYGFYTNTRTIGAPGTDGINVLLESLTGLLPNRHYHVRIMVKLNGHWTPGVDVEFVTDPTLDPNPNPTPDPAPNPCPTDDSCGTIAAGVQDGTTTTKTITNTQTVTNTVTQTAPAPKAVPAAVPAACRGVAIVSRSRGIQLKLDAYVTKSAPMTITPGKYAKNVSRVVIDGKVVKTTVKGRTVSLPVGLLKPGRHTIVVGTGAKAARVTVSVGTCKPKLALWRLGAKGGITLSVVPGTKAATITVAKAYAKALKGATVSVKVGRTFKAIKATIKGNVVTVGSLPANATGIRVTYPRGAQRPPAKAVTGSVTSSTKKTTRLQARRR